MRPHASRRPSKAPLATLLAALHATSCGPLQQNASDLRVTDGKIIGDDDKPAIVQISADLGGGAAAACTATWVSDNTIVTAAHCLFDRGQRLSNVTVVRGAGKGARATRVLTHPKYVDAGVVPQDAYDVGLLVFPANTSSQSIAVAPAAPAAGDTISIVGFGKYDHSNGSSGGKKRTGTNEITDVDRQGRLNFEGTPRPTTGTDDGTGQNVVNSQGDSGGPMLFRDQIIGVSSSVDANLTSRGELRGHYENLRHPPITQWLEQMKSQGALIRGITADAGTTPPADTPPTTGPSKDVFAMALDGSETELRLMLAGAETVVKIVYASAEAPEALAGVDAATMTAATKRSTQGDRSFFEATLPAPTTGMYLLIRALGAGDVVLAEQKAKVDRK